MDLMELKITYEELFELLEFDDKAYHQAQLNQKNIYIDTPTGYTKILGGVIKDNLDMINIKFEDDTECNVAKGHIFSFNGEEVFAEDANIVDSKSGKLRILRKTEIGKHDGYDINISDPHWYYSPNNVIYHNSLMMTDIISGLIVNNKNILLVSLEMADKEIMKRVHANAMDLPINSLIDLAKTQAELDALGRPYVTKQMIIDAYNKVKFSGTCGKLFIKDYPSGSFSPLMLEQLVDSYRIEQNIEFDAVFVDYLGIMKSDLLTPSAGLYSYVKSIAEETRSVAKKLDVAIISASQLNRAATNNIDDADNSNVSDSMGTVMTADFMLFLLQDEKMKERKEIVCKITKNRFGGVTDSWRMGVDYEHMRFSDQLVQENDLSNIDITNTLGLNKSQKLSDDFAVLTINRNNEAEKYASDTIKDIVRKDVQKVIQHDKKDPFKNDLDELYKSLGL